MLPQASTSVSPNKAPFIFLYKDVFHGVGDCGGDSEGQCLKGRRLKEPFETLVAPHYPTPTAHTPGPASRPPGLRWRASHAPSHLSWQHRSHPSSLLSLHLNHEEESGSAR